MVYQETLLNYQDWSKPFDNHTNASDYQLGAVISQDKKVPSSVENWTVLNTITLPLRKNYSP